MKIKIPILLFIAVLTIGNAHATFLRDSIPAKQISVRSDFNDLLKKSRRQQTTGWLLLGGGGAMTIVGAYILLYEVLTLFTPEAKDHTNSGELLMYGGIGVMLLSIPFLISGIKNRRKAKLLMKKESLGTNMGNQSIQPFTSIGFRINF